MSDKKPDIIFEFRAWNNVGVVGYSLDSRYTREPGGIWKKTLGAPDIAGMKFLAEIKRLKVIVDKLDRTDDNVPITPRMEVWRTGTITYSNGATLTVTTQRSFVELRIPGGEFVGSVHSTREAADAAKEKS